jgi:DNA-binding MarR family transcriptional regulator
MNEEGEIIESAKCLYLTCRAIIALCNQKAKNTNIDGASPIAIHMCHLVQQYEPVTVTEIAQHLNISAPYASTVVDDLVHKKVLRREKDQYDRRKCVITIAPEATKTIECMEFDILFPIYKILKMVGVDKTRK